MEDEKCHDFFFIFCVMMRKEERGEGTFLTAQAR